MKKILVLCIDRDDDLGKKAKVKSPVIGEEENLKAAQALGLADPGDSDINAIYKAVRTYKELKKTEKHVIVVTLAGHKSRGYKADKAVAEQLEKIVKENKITEIIMISDGADDEQLLPIIQGYARIASVSPVIVKQTKELEQSYYVIKELLSDPHFARLIFGLPGIILAIWGIVSWLNIQAITMNVVAGLVGIYLIMKGFGIEDSLVKTTKRFMQSTSIERASFPLYLSSFFVFLLSLWAAYDNIAFVTRGIPESVLVRSQLLINVAAFVSGFIGLFTIAIALFLAGRVGDMYYKKEYHRIKKYARMVVSAMAFYIVIDNATKFVLFWTSAISAGPSFTDLLVSVGLAFMTTIVGFMVVNYIYIKKYVSKRIEKGLAVRDVEGKGLGTVSTVDLKNHVFRYTKGKNSMSARFAKVVKIKDSIIIQ